MPSIEELESAINAAESSHHQFQTVYLKGVRDEHWASYYSAFVLGRVEKLDITPSELCGVLSAVTDDDWTAGAAKAIRRASGS
jgi:hypothetical protein